MKASMNFIRALLVIAIGPWWLAGCGETKLPAAPTSGDRTEARTPVVATQVDAKVPTPTTDETAEPKDEVAEPVAPKPAPKSSTPKNITFDTVKFDMKKEDPFKRSMLTPAIEALDGQKVRIRGFILPSFQQTGITQFVLVRDNLECCFGPGAALYDCIVVEMIPGKSADFTIRPVAVDGLFKIQEYLDPEGIVRAIYHLDGDAVK